MCLGWGNGKEKEREKIKIWKKKNLVCLLEKENGGEKKEKKEGGKEVKGLRVNTCSSPPLSLEGVRVVFLLFFP